MLWSEAGTNNRAAFGLRNVLPFIEVLNAYSQLQ